MKIWHKNAAVGSTIGFGYQSPYMTWVASWIEFSLETWCYFNTPEVGSWSRCPYVPHIAVTQFALNRNKCPTIKCLFNVVCALVCCHRLSLRDVSCVSVCCRHDCRWKHPPSAGPLFPRRPARQPCSHSAVASVQSVITLPCCLYAHSLCPVLRNQDVCDSFKSWSNANLNWIPRNFELKFHSLHH